MFDCHVHGYRSFDSKAKYADLLAFAVNSGLDGIILTEHLDLKSASEIKFDFNSYENEIRNINQEMSGEILIGLELGLTDYSISELNDFIAKNNFDCVIGSIHIVNNEDPYYPAYYENKDKHKAYTIVFEKYIELLPKYPGINILGHFDYISRYGEKYKDKNIYYSEFSDYFDSIFKYIIDNQIALEINTSTYRKRGSHPENILDINILKRYRQLGGELVTLGSDAHSPDDIGYNFKYFLQVLHNCGFKYIAHFKKRTPLLEKIII